MNEHNPQFTPEEEELDLLRTWARLAATSGEDTLAQVIAAACHYWGLDTDHEAARRMAASIAKAVRR